MNALITGAAGFIGSHLTAQLLARGADVTGIDCFTDYYPRPMKEANLAVNAGKPRFRFVEANLLDADLDGLLEDKTHVFHLAAQAGVRKSWGRDFAVYTANNIDATQRLLEACAGRPLDKLVYASSSSVYGDEAAIPMRESQAPRPVSPYGVTKLAAEHLCHLYASNHGVPATSLRYFTVYGPRQRPDMAFRKFLTAAAAGHAIGIFGDGRQTRDFTFVDDAVAATIAAGERGVPGRAYNIGGGSRVALDDVLTIIEQVVGRPLRVERGPAQKGDMRDTYADTSLARADLGFAPSVALADGIAAEYQWLATLPVHA
jgi:UDP-glucose 4-epimerase